MKIWHIRAERSWEKARAWESWMRKEVETSVQRALQGAGAHLLEVGRDAVQ